MGSRAVSDTGPILHLFEISSLKCMNIFSQILIPKVVEKELMRNNFILIKKIKIINLNSESKDKANILMHQFNIDLGESEAISLALQEKTDYFLTDDLDAKKIAKRYHLEAHGTIGIIMRSYREKIISKTEALEKIKELKSKSSLFITRDLIEMALDSINNFKS